MARLEIDLHGQSNFAFIFAALNSSKDRIELFQTVRHINFIDFVDFKYQDSFKEFIANFRKIESIEGISTESFNPLQIFIDAGKRVPKVFWSPSEKQVAEKV